MAEYIASGTTAADGADITLADGAAATLNLFAAGASIPYGCVAVVQVKSSNGQYYQLGELDSVNPCLQVFGPGTYRVSRRASGTAFGVDKS
jgi:hypothetical protein